jgi:hypothetical protein
VDYQKLLNVFVLGHLTHRILTLQSLLQNPPPKYPILHGLELNISIPECVYSDMQASSLDPKI